MTAPVTTLSRASDLDASYIPRDTGMAWVRDNVLLTIGSAGAVSAVNKAFYSFTHGSTGVYAIIFPKCRDVKLSVARLKSAALTVTGIVVTAYDAKAGTASITFVGGAGVATDPASGDELLLCIELKTESTP
jgi:hypothetical protein